MSFHLSPVYNHPVIDENGNPLNGGLLFIWTAGSTTPAITYKDPLGLQPQSNPIVLNSLGAPDSPIWLDSGKRYRFELTDDSGARLGTTYDFVVGINDVSQPATNIPGVSVTLDEWVLFPQAPTRLNGSQISLSGVFDTILHAGRRVRLTQSGGYSFGTISAVSVAGQVTTVTIGGLTVDPSLTVLSYGIVSAKNSSLPGFGLVPQAQCYMRLQDENTAILSPFGGKVVSVVGAGGDLIQTSLPNGGLSFSAPAGAPSTMQYFYVSANAVGDPLPSVSATGYEQDGTYGFPVMLGDRTKRLVGKAFTTSASKWDVNSPTCFLSYYNRKSRTTKKIISGIPNISSGQNSPYNNLPVSGHEVPFIVWDDDPNFSGGYDIVMNCDKPLIILGTVPSLNGSVLGNIGTRQHTNITFSLTHHSTHREWPTPQVNGINYFRPLYYVGTDPSTGVGVTMTNQGTTIYVKVLG